MIRVHQPRSSLLALLAVLFQLSATPRAARGEEAGLLLSGPDPALLRRVEGALVPSLRRQNLAVFDYQATRDRLLRAEAVRSAVQSATEEVSRSQQDALFMKRQSAVEHARRAITRLSSVGARFHSPSLLAQAEAALALALLLHPPDEQGALSAFRAARQADPGVEPDPDRLPPRATELLTQARGEPIPSTPPQTEELARMAELAGTERLVWLSAEQGPVGVKLEARLYRGAGSPLVVRRSDPLSEARLGDGATLLVAGLLRRGAPDRTTPSSDGPAPVLGAADGDHERPRTDQHRPWYRAWWVWAVAGAVTAGAAVAIGISVSQSRDQPDLLLHLRY